MSPPLAKARRLLLTARRALDDGDTASAGNRAYFAAFEAVRLILKTISAELAHAKTHRGIEQAFNLHVVKAGLLPKSVAKDFSFLLELRWQADYDMESDPTTEEAQRGLAAAGTIVAAVEAFLDAAGGRTP